MSDAYLRQREFFSTISGNYHVLATDSGLIVLVAAFPKHTTFLQKIHIEVTTLAGAALWNFQDGAGTPVPIVPAVSAAAVAHFDFVFGANGVPCTEGTAFLLNITGGAGSVGWATWEGYRKLTLGAAA
jgi:hypothetical protein